MKVRAYIDMPEEDPKLARAIKKCEKYKTRIRVLQDRCNDYKARYRSIECVSTRNPESKRKTVVLTGFTDQNPDHVIFKCAISSTLKITRDVNEHTAYVIADKTSSSDGTENSPWKTARTINEKREGKIGMYATMADFLDNFPDIKHVFHAIREIIP